MGQVATDRSESFLLLFPGFGEVDFAAGGGAHAFENGGGNRFQLGFPCTDHVNRNTLRLCACENENAARRRQSGERKIRQTRIRARTFRPIPSECGHESWRRYRREYSPRQRWASVNINNDRVELNDLNATVMNGQVNGRAVIAFNGRTRSDVNASFTDLDLSKLLALQGGRVIPLEGKATGRVDLNFAGTNLNSATGTVNADIAANAGNADKGFIPVNGTVALTATNGLFNVDQAKFNTANSQLNASGHFDLRDNNSDLDVALNSTDASEVERLVRLLNVSPDLENQLNSMQMQFAGNLNFNGKLTGNASDPVIDGRAAVGSRHFAWSRYRSGFHRYRRFASRS